MLTGQQFGRYEIRSKLGEGGMGEVYTALDPELGRHVAIKLLPGEFTHDADRRSRFRQEARVISALNHPNIITIYEIGENEHGSFLATEYVEGRTLRDVIKHESLTMPRILHLIEQAANALVAAHAARIIHRDIKPENIMVRRDSIVKVLDFGLAKPDQIDTNGDLESNKTVPGTVMGSARYMSPEQARGLEVDERTDIWSLGVVLFEMLTGTVPFSGETTADTLAAVIYKDPPSISLALPNAPTELQRILRKALQKDRDERYQSMKDLALDIKDLVFEIEHANSGDRSSSHISSSPSFSENPTIIHTTISANHPTDKSHAMTSASMYHHSPSDYAGGKRWLFPGALAALLVIVAGGFGFYHFLRSGPAQQAETAFDQTQISRISSDGKVAQAVMSPDGRYVAYVAGEVGNRSLVVRQVATDSSVTVVQPTNLNLQNLMFSPDGDHIYYTQTRSDGSVNTLYNVPTLGGTPRKLIEDVDSSVAFSPDGKRFVFMRHATTDNTDNMFIADTATLEQQPLVSTPGTGYDFFSNRFAWSPDGKKILMGAGRRQSSFVTGTDLAEISIDEKSIRKIDSGKEFFNIFNFAWFDDGSGFLFTARETQNAPAQIWRASYPAMELRQVTNDFNDYFDLGISADGRSAVTVKGDTSGSLWRFTPGVRSAEQLTSESRNIQGAAGLSQAADGRLVFTHHEGKEVDIWTADADGKNGRSLIAEPGFSVAPVFSPNGKTIVFNLQKDKMSAIWRMDADGKNLVRLTEDSFEHADFNPQVTPDGTAVIFQRQPANVERTVLMKVGINGGPAELFYSDEKHSVFQQRISPDGKRMSFVTYDVKNFVKHLNIATLEGNSFGRVERQLEYNLIQQIQWTPDSKSLTVMSNRGGMMNLWKIPVDGSAATPVTDFKSGRIMNFTWTADGKNILILRANQNNDLVLIRDAARLDEKAQLKRLRRFSAASLS